MVVSSSSVPRRRSPTPLRFSRPSRRKASLRGTASSRARVGALGQARSGFAQALGKEAAGVQPADEERPLADVEALQRLGLELDVVEVADP